ncbi:MAG: ATP-dependent Clp protease proteolytic subunit [Candidatus Peribacteraceae bacterium]|nr:ATP-dependent Clp protease proteolytic subunit [Candidatus Peribacteraceae bacterium]
MHNPLPKTQYINYFDAIDPVRVKTLMAVITDILNREKPDVLYVLFASGGGNVDAGIVLYNFLKSLPVRLVMHNTGVINSIANVVFMAGAERYAARHSSFLFHGIAAGFATSSLLNLKQMRERVSSLESDERKIVGILSDNCRLSPKTLAGLFDTGEAVSVEFAKENGIIHDIREPNIPKGAHVMTVDIQTKH